MKRQVQGTPASALKIQEGIMKKLIPIILIALVMGVFGCGKATVSENEKTEYGVEQVQSTWVDNHVPLHNFYKKSVIEGDMIYSCAYSGEKMSVVYQDKKDGTISREVSLPDISEVHSMHVDVSGNVYITGSDGEKTSFWKIDGAGNVTGFENMTLEDMESVKHTNTPKGIYADNNGFSYLWYRLCILVKEIYNGEELQEFLKESPVKDAYGHVERIYVKDAQMDTLFYVQVPSLRGSRLINFYLNESGEAILLAEDAEGIYTQQIDVTQQKTTEKNYFDTGIEISYETSHMVALENGFLCCQDGHIYKFDYNTNEYEQLLTLSSYGISADNISYLGLQDNKIEIISCDAENSLSTYTLLEEGETQKLVLTLGVLQEDTELSKFVTDYNRQQSDIRIEMMPYYNEDMDYEDALTRLNLDIITGDAPDIIDVSSLNYGILAEKGIFVDLYELMEEDMDLRKADLLSSVVQPYEMNEKLYAVAPAFQLHSMWGKSSVVKGRSGVSLEELRQILFDAGKDLSAIGGFSVDEPVLVTLCTFGMNEIVDWEAKTCNFEGEYFKGILRFVKEYDEKKKEADPERSIENGGILLIGGSIFGVSDYQLEKKRYGEDISFIGYPTSEGSGTAISLRGSQLAINAKEEHQEEAWEFIKYYILNGYNDGGFPILETKFEEYLVKAQEPVIEVDVEGTRKVPSGSYFNGEDMVTVYEASKEEVEVIRNLVENATNVFEYDTTILNIIQEEAGAYLTGDKTIEQVTGVIQSKIEVYLAE